ncbi:MAG TPA: hypothetical protein VMU53_09240 [Candidatus Sulfotelmatobacter sp.]|nr:hypothetical protein [Candidatus Sulfotelmatobacter sp.]
MELQITTELKGRMLLVTATGSYTFDAAVRLLKQVLDTAKEKQVSKILVNTLAMDRELSIIDRHILAVEVVEYAKRNQMVPRLAFVGKPPTVDGFGVRVAQNRGLTTDVFSSEQEALNWLEKWPS